MGQFKQYLRENEDLLQKINDELAEMDEDEIDEFGYVLYAEFFDEDEPTEEMDFFSIEDIQDMIAELGPDFYEDILDMIEDEDEDEDEEDEEMDEGVSRMMKAGNKNRKKRKFMSKSAAELRRTKAARKKDNRANRAERKKYYRANKAKIAAYQKSRASAIAKGSHKVKLRRKAG